MSGARPAFGVRARIAREKVVAASVAGHDAEGFLTRVVAAVADVVPHDAGGWCVTDPGTMLWTGGTIHGFPDDVAAGFYENELLDGDFLAFRRLALRRSRVGVLSRETAGELDRSPRHRRLFAPYGLADELRLAAVADGTCFGTACIVRRHGAEPFTAAEADFVHGIGPHVAHGLRAALLGSAAAGGPSGRPGPTGPVGVMVLDDELQVVSVDAVAEAALDELGWGYGVEGLPPIAVISVVAQARAAADGAGPDASPPYARVRTRAGRWLSVTANAIASPPGGWSVVVAPSRPAEVLPLVAEAHGLTPREHDVFGLLLRGVPHKLIARQLGISDHTAREHVRKVQQKLGVSSRAELQALMFEEHYAPSFFTLPA